MNSSRAFMIANDLVKLHLPAWKFGWSIRATKSAGLCDHRNKTIELSYTLTVQRKESAVIETLLHEIAHGLCKKRGHGRDWAMICAQIGGNPAPKYSMENDREKVSL